MKVVQSGSDHRIEIVSREGSSPTPDYRYIYINNHEKNSEAEFRSNYIRTSKYTLVSFLPKFFFETFRKVANAYFLVVSILQTITAISNTDGRPSTAVTLFFIVFVDAIFAILEDHKRHVADDIANSRECDVLDVQLRQMFKRKWADIQVGDIICLHNRESIPADILVLAVHEAPGAPPVGICYVETKSLDGETNLKLRQAMESTLEKMRSIEDLCDLRGVVQCDKPNNQINKFSGTLTLGDGTKEAIPPKSVLLRGCTVRNTEWIYGLVLNTGNDTKIMMSNTSTPSKLSSMEISINKYILYIVGFLVLCCAVGSTGAMVWNEKYANIWYLSYWTPEAGGEWIIKFFYFFLLMYQFIPISLYVSMNMVKYIQAIFIQSDKHIYYSETDTPATVRTMTLNEELGQISYIFSDKTGTLTCNIMEFRKCSIGGVSYGKGTTEIGLAALERHGKNDIADEYRRSTSEKADCNRIPFVNFDSDEIVEDMKGGKGPEQVRRIDAFFRHLAICHTVIPEKSDSGDVTLSASSPDEQALVSGAKFMGYEFIDRGPGVVYIRVPGQSERLEFYILDILEFDSARKRMSVVVKERSTGKISLYIKGADSVIYPRLRNVSCDERDETDMEEDELNPQKMLNTTIEHVEKYAEDGLRTLVIAHREIDTEQYEVWSKKYQEALTNLDEIEKRKCGTKNAIDSLMEEIEVDLELLGATAIEDKLQQNVPSTIAKLALAGIKIWVLTGDKEETAINIGFACRLLHNDMKLMIVNLDTYPTEKEMLVFFKQQIIERANEVRRYYRKPTSERTGLEEMALVIDGEALEYALKGKMRCYLLELAQFCKAVVGCRVSPAQKAEMVALIKDNLPEVKTLAIGDGANDVSMIQEAHIGVGISGQEGMQAVNASDYAIARFHFLERLLLVHGRWNYKRMSRLVVYMFYKNIMLTASQYWYAYFSGLSGQKFFLEAGLQLYNIAFTALPIVLLGIFDQDVRDSMAVKYPKLYIPGQLCESFNMRIFFSWILEACLESIGITMLVLHCMDNVDYEGRDTGMWMFGAMVFTLVVIVANLKLMFYQESWTWFTYTTFLVSILFWFLTAIISSHMQMIGGIAWSNLFTSILMIPSFWLSCILVSVAMVVPKVFEKAWKDYFYPEYYNLVREVTKYSLPETNLHWTDPNASLVDMPVGFDVKSLPVERLNSVSMIELNSRVNLYPNEKRKSRYKFMGFAFSYDPKTGTAEALMAKSSIRRVLSGRILSPKGFRYNKKG